jgi:ribonuclease HI
VKSRIDIYTDGSSRGNPGPGGYGIIMVSGPHMKEFSQGFRKTTNNRMELMAVIVALKQIKSPGHEVVIYSDSKYVVDAIEKNWIKGWVKKAWKDVKNPDLWKEYLKVAENHSVRFVWVRGHNGHPMNERCDVLAVEAAMGRGLLIDTGYEESVSTGLY